MHACVCALYTAQGVLRAVKMSPDALDILTPGLIRREWRGMEWGRDGGSMVTILKGMCMCMCSVYMYCEVCSVSMYCEVCSV
jgi:hypothetical protein